MSVTRILGIVALILVVVSFIVKSELLIPAAVFTLAVAAIAKSP